MKKSVACALLASVGFVASVSAEFMVGYGKVDITPPMGTPLSGYTYARAAEGVLDPLDAIALAFSDGTNRAVVLSLDIISLRGYFDLYREGIAAAAGLDPQAVFIACSHTHTGPLVGSCIYGQKFDTFERASNYEKWLLDQLASAAKLALGDLAPAKLAIARGEAKDISFIRRYRMKDGSCRTNPGVGNPDIVAPLGESDDMVQLVRVDRPGKDSIAIVNFQCHPDTIGGSKISADWPRVVRETVESVLDDVKCVMVNGPQGDSNHICTDPAKRTPYLTRKTVYKHMGRKVGGVAVGLWDACKPVESGKVGYSIVKEKVKTNRGRPDQLPEAKRIMELTRNGQFGKIPGDTGMQKTTAQAEARRIVYLADGPDYFDFPLSAVTVGDTLAFVGFPGEPFTGYGVSMKKLSPYAMTVAACLVNGNFGYLPTDEAFKETGYETQGSLFVKGLEKTVVEGHLNQLNRLFKSR